MHDLIIKIVLNIKKNRKNRNKKNIDGKMDKIVQCKNMKDEICI